MAVQKALLKIYKKHTFPPYFANNSHSFHLVPPFFFLLYYPLISIFHALLIIYYVHIRIHETIDTKKRPRPVERRERQDEVDICRISSDY